MSSSALDVRGAARAWATREVAARPLVLFRVWFGAVWLAYDALDLALGGTAHCWAAPDTTSRFVLVQLGLIACEIAMVAGVRPALAAGVAAVLRVVEIRDFPLNDFLYFTVVAAILSQTGGRRGAPSVRRWPLDLLVTQAGWMYVATAVLKLNPEWLSGGSLWVRTRHLARFIGWPYPSAFDAVLASRSADAALAAIAVAGELTLGALLLFRRAPRVALALAIAIHAVGALVTNVWFFGASMIAHAALFQWLRVATPTATAPMMTKM